MKNIKLKPPRKFQYIYLLYPVHWLQQFMSNALPNIFLQSMVHTIPAKRCLLAPSALIALPSPLSYCRQGLIYMSLEGEIRMTTTTRIECGTGGVVKWRRILLETAPGLLISTTGPKTSPSCVPGTSSSQVNTCNSVCSCTSEKLNKSVCYGNCWQM